jgi:phospholipase C
MTTRRRQRPVAAKDPASARTRRPAAPARPPDPVEHVIVLMLENRAFDHALGSLQQVLPTLNGIPPNSPPRENWDSAGHPYPQQPTTATRTTYDLPHETPQVLAQIAGHNSGFVKAYESEYPTSTQLQRQEVMSHYDVGRLPALHALAQSFLVCDAWHASVPGPTWTNRFFVHSGTSLGRVKMPNGIFHPHLHWYNQDTIYDRLNDQDIPWRIYAGDIPQSLVLVHQLRPANAKRYHPLSDFFDHVQKPDGFPAYVFIEPFYFGPDQNDDHPPSDVLAGERLVADVYNSLRRSALWEKSLLVVLFDEHGGLYDHVEPPPAIPPDNHREEYTFDRLGVRVPAILVSPWVAPGILHDRFDHTSLLHYLTDKWGLPALGDRAAVAPHFRSAIGATGQVRTDTPSRIEVPAPRAVPAKGPSARAAAAPPAPLNGNQHALIGFSQYLESKTRDTPARKVGRSVRMMRGPEETAAVAIERVQRFLAQQRQGRSAWRTFGPPPGLETP